MAPTQWDEEDSESSTPPSSPPQVARRAGKFGDEEDSDGDVLDSWDAAEDSEVEREKAKKAAEAKAKADAEAKASHKTKSQRIEERRQQNLQRQQENEMFSSDDEDEATRRARLRKEQQQADLAHAEDLFGDLAVKSSRSKPVTLQDPTDPANTLDISTLPIFDPSTKDQFTKLRETLIPLITANSKKAHYTLFMQEFAKQLCKDLPSDQVKKIASGLTTLSNEKMKEEKLAEKGGKKTKAKAKATLVATRDISYKADTGAYDDDGLDDGDFM